MKANQAKRTIKVSLKGETKRLKIADNYSDLLNNTKKAFGQALPAQYKFFYLDEENEVISINSQSDLTEAFDFDASGTLKLIIAVSAVDARDQLLRNLEDNRSVAESLNASQIMGMGPMRSSRLDREDQMMLSEFDRVSHAEFRDADQFSAMSEIKKDEKFATMNAQSKFQKQFHEIACGGDTVMDKAVERGTDVANLVSRSNVGSLTERVSTKDQTSGTRVDTMSLGCQVEKQTKDTGCDGIKADTQAQGCQMNVVMSDSEVNCQLLIPDEADNEEAIEQEVICFKCTGSKVNKKGLPCRKCKATGVIMSNELSEITKLVKAEVGEYCREKFTEMFKNYLVNKKSEQDAQVHTSIECDGCGVNPIKGIRYQSTFYNDYDICEACEKKGIHKEHPLIKIRRPGQAPFKVITQMTSNQTFHAQQQKANASNGQQPAKANRQQSAAKQNPVARYSGRFVRESMKDQTQVEAGSHFRKTWTFRNDGQISWPSGTKLVKSCGDNLGESTVSLIQEIQPNSEVDFTVDFVAPKSEGKYTAFFRLQIGNIKFGQKVWCDIMVVKPKPAPVEQVKMVAQDNVEMVSHEVKPDEKVIEPPYSVFMKSSSLDEQMKDLKIADDKDSISCAGDKESDLVKSFIDEAKIVSPKQIYEDAANKETSDMKLALMNLFEFGFTDFKINKALMQKYKNANVVAEKLCMGIDDKELQDLLLDQELYE